MVVEVGTGRVADGGRGGLFQSDALHDGETKAS